MVCYTDYCTHDWWSGYDIIGASVRFIIYYGLFIALFVIWFMRRRKVRRNRGSNLFLWRFQVPPSIIPGFDRLHPDGWMQPAAAVLDGNGEFGPELMQEITLYKNYQANILENWKPGTKPPPRGVPSFLQYQQDPLYYNAQAKYLKENNAPVPNGILSFSPPSAMKRSPDPNRASAVPVGASNQQIIESAIQRN